MQLAYELACKGQFSTYPNPAVGCVLVADDCIVGTGWHAKAGQNHAEINALADAKVKGHSVYAATAYVTLEPCCHYGKTPPCVDALLEAQIHRVVIACVDMNPEVAGKGIERLRQHHVAVTVLKADAQVVRQCQQLNQGYAHFCQYKQPWVRLKWAQSLDGYCALADGRSQWISGTQSRADVQRWRARSQAIISTAKSVIADEARLTVRLDQYCQTKRPQPLRVVLDAQLSLTADLALFQQLGDVLLVTQAHPPTKIVPYQQQFVACKASVTLLQLPPTNSSKHANTNQHLDINAVLQHLAKRQCYEVLIEAGSQFSSSCLRQDLVHELIIYVNSRFFGKGLKAIKAPTLEDLSKSNAWSLRQVQQFDQDVRLSLIKNL